MINIYLLNRYCKDDISLIENYEEAINSKETYDCHHRLETDLNVTQQYLIDNDLYYNRSANELIFLPHNEHISLHNKCRQVSEETKKKISESKKYISEETRKKLSEAQKGKTSPMKGKHLSEEAKRKISEAKKGKKSPCGMFGKHHSKETKIKISKALKTYEERTNNCNTKNV